jgi:predicted DCC family thiol-disulfide oxidoreductase YuxK
MTNQFSLGLPSTVQASQAIVLYDGQCPLCRKSVEILRRLDWLRKLRYGDARDPEQVPVHDPPLTPAQLLEEMHLLTPDGKHVYRGFAAFRWMAWQLPLLWPITLFLYLPGIPAVGVRLYRWIARNRFQLVPCQHGVCNVHGPKSNG